MEVDVNEEVKKKEEMMRVSNVDAAKLFFK